MPTKSYFLRKDNFDNLNKSAEKLKVTPSEYLNRLIEKENPFVPKEGRHAPEPSPWVCRECDEIKVAGRCINKNCKLKGKLQ